MGRKFRPTRAFGWFGLAVSEVAVGELEQAREHMAQGEAFGVRPPGFEHTFATSWTLEPAERAILAPCPGFSSMLCTSVPVGMFSSGSALPGVMSACGPDSTIEPTTSRAGAMM